MNQPTPHASSNEPARFCEGGMIDDAHRNACPATHAPAVAPRIVTPEEAEGWVVTYASRRPLLPSDQTFQDLAHTVATEPDRTRAAVVKALREAGNREEMPHEVQAFVTGMDRMEIARYLDDRATAIENGADL